MIKLLKKHNLFYFISYSTRTFVWLLCLLTFPNLYAQEEASLEFPAESNGIFAEGKPIEVIFYLKNPTQRKISGQLICQFSTLQQQNLSNEVKPIEVYPKDLQALVFSFQPSKAGFYKITVKLESTQSKLNVNSLVAGYAIDQMQVNKSGKPDFDTFWQKTRQELAQVAPNFRLTKKTELSTAQYDIYLVEMQSLDNMTIRGIYRTPKNKRNVPAILQLPSLGGGFTNPKSLDEQPLYGVPLDFAVLSLNIRGHGNSKDHLNVGKDVFTYITHNLHDKNKYVYRGAVADAIRGLDFLSQRLEIDKERIAIEGASQGGGLSLIVAALDNRVKLCAADVPFLCDIENLTTQTGWVKNEIEKYIKKNKNLSYHQALNNLSYFDTKNFAPMIKIPVLMSTGLQDNTCPPATNFATFNQIKSTFKQYCVYPYGKHGGGGVEHRKLKFNWIRSWFGM
ncbi:acetylxylan esterase [Thermoflexibacter ruber]|uniref:Acetyl xylan esterase (AXE1) n=1 Tax=Thermoflexibacter ruber TaxID=1003 RepID=A0A1I2HA22_9BACT|nr:acetylxylan esterase [Thermoflexibacter ruber]SFF25586.1 Acetyl xylan esterase (AXE1) [Thermoflexibacter ruber]